MYLHTDPHLEIRIYRTYMYFYSHSAWSGYVYFSMDIYVYFWCIYSPSHPHFEIQMHAHPQFVSHQTNLVVVIASGHDHGRRDSATRHVQPLQVFTRNAFTRNANNFPGTIVWISVMSSSRAHALLYRVSHTLLPHAYIHTRSLSLVYSPTHIPYTHNNARHSHTH